MLLTITTTHRPATDLGFLLHKHPGRFQSYELSFGKAHAFYPEATDDRCTACLLLDVDPVGVVRGKDRPELTTAPLPLEARIDVLPVRGGERFLRAVFEPLGYSVEAVQHPLDERFPEWGESPYFSVAIAR